MDTHRLTLKKPLAFLDLETTGISTMYDRIVEIAVLVLLPNGTSRTLSHRVNPGIAIPPEATAVHGITDADVALEPTFRSLAPRIRDFLEGCDLSGYNIRRFDLPLLLKEFERAGVPFEIGDFHVVDVQTIFHAREPRDLSAALRYYCERDHEGAHGALADVIATADIFQAQLERYQDLPGDIAELERIIHPRNPSWVDDDGKLAWEGEEAVFTFGKHRGHTLRSVLAGTPDYLDWILGGDFPRSFKDIIANARRGYMPVKPDPEQR